jgi:rubrerythrin/DNA-directed RNA polymerase subunit RPC12/RpoP
MKKEEKKPYTCEQCGAEADLVIEGLEGVEDVVKRKQKRRVICRSCGHEKDLPETTREPFACEHCGAEADMTLAGFEKVEDVIKREKRLTCRRCGQGIPWTEREDLKAIEIAMHAEKEASQFYAQASKKTKDPKGREMFLELSRFEAHHYDKLKELLKSLEERKEWILYSGTHLKAKSIPLKIERPKGQEQLSDMDALKIAIREEKKARSFYSSMAELTQDPRGKDMYKRLADEEALHEKVLNDQYYSLHNTGVWSWGD